MWRLLPQHPATLLKPVVQGIQRGQAWNGLPKPVTCVLNILLDLSFLPTRCGIAELGFEQIVAGHCHEADIDVALLASSDPVDRRLHVVVDAAPGNAAKHTESVIVRVKQHLVRLQQVSPNNEGTAVAQLRMGHLQLRALIADDCPVFGPIELERFAGLKHQGNEGPTAGRLQLPLPISSPIPGKGRHPIV